MGHGTGFHHEASRRGSLCRLLPPLLAALLAATGGCGRHEASESAREKPAAQVKVVTVEPRDAPVSFEYVARVQSSRQVNIQARVSGFLEKRTYTEGAMVEEGQTLFVMDQKPYKVQLAQAQAALARQQAAFEVARLNLARVKPLAAAEALSQKDLDDATGQFESAAAAVEQAKASVEQARLDLSYTVIASPVAGASGSAQQAEGAYLSPSNSQLTTVTVLSPAYVNFSISENERLRYRDQVARGLLVAPKDLDYEVEIILADGSLYPETGKLTFTDPSFDPATGTFLIRATVQNSDGFLRPNQFVRIRLKGVIRPRAILVPQRAVQPSSRGHFVWVAADGTAEMRPVVTGEWLGNDWLIREGLHAGDQVVVDGGLTLRPGAPLAATPQAANAGAGAPAESGR